MKTAGSHGFMVSCELHDAQTYCFDNYIILLITKIDFMICAQVDGNLHESQLTIL